MATKLNMRMIRHLLSIISCIVIPSFSMAQANCLQQLQAICRQEHDYQRKMMESNGWYLKYRLESQAYNPGKDTYMPTVTDGEMITSKNIRYFKTQALEVFIDGEDIFTVDNSRRTVMRVRSGQQVMSPQSNPYLDLLNDSTMKAYRVTGCQVVKELGMQLKRYDMVAVDKTKTPYTKVQIYIDEGQKMFVKIYADINPAFYKAISSYTFIVKERGKRSVSSWYPVRKKVVAANGKLKAPYTNYKYTDLATRNPIKTN